MSFLNCAHFFYGRAQISTRNVVERSYGILKRRFPVLESGMKLRRLDLIQKIVAVCCVLHNLCIDMGTDVDLNLFGEPIAEGIHDQQVVQHPINERRRLVREEIVEIFAQRLHNFNDE